MTHRVFRTGDGPAVIVMHEVAGITPPTVRLAELIAENRFAVFMPLLFGGVGQSTRVRRYAALAQACLSREFTIFARGRTSPIVGWLRCLAQEARRECEGRGVGVIGMCFTGGFALAMMADDAVVAPVLSQPSLPAELPLIPCRATRADLGLSPEDLERVKRRRDTGARFMGLRFTCDRISPGERFAALRDLLGDRFLAVEVPSWPGNRHGIRGKAHSVLTGDSYLGDDREHVVDDPTIPAIEAVIGFLTRELRAASS
jgi:dienelactone hydrolase